MMYRDDDGNRVTDGDMIRFSYGIPPVGVTAPVCRINGLLVALTPDHNPRWCPLKDLAYHVGNYYKVDESDYSSRADQLARALHHRDETVIPNMKREIAELKLKLKVGPESYEREIAELKKEIEGLYEDQAGEDI